MDLKLNQIWYVKLPGNRAITEATVIDVTKHTVLLSIPNDSLVMFGLEDMSASKDRYAIDDIKWIELKE